MDKYGKILLRLKLAVTALSVLGAGVSLTMVALRMAPRAEAGYEEIRLPVLMYHAVIGDDARAGDYVITPKQLRQDLEYIRSCGYETVVTADIIAYVKSGSPLPEKPVMITFDDGYYNNYLYAYPLLKEMGMRAVLSVIGVEADRYTDTPDESEYYSHCTWAQLREMAESGVMEIQSHSYDLHHLEADHMGIDMFSGEELTAYRTRLHADLARMQERCRAELGTVPNVFAYPFGASPADSAPVLRELGFEATLGTSEKTFLLTRDPKCLESIPRYNRPASRSAESILASA